MIVSYQGRQMEAVDIDFLTRKEDFNEYQLTDGGVIKLKTVVTRIVRIEGEITPDGQPVYQIQSTNVVRLM